MRRILLAGTALLALTAAQPTLAADAPVYKGPAPVAAAVYNAWYISVFGGWSTVGNRQYGFSFVSNATGAQFPYTISLDNGWVFGGAIGKEINPNLRLEIELAHSRFNFGNDYVSPLTGFVGLGESGSLGLTSLLANAWFGGNLGWAYPYIGGGLGVVFANGSLTITNGAGPQISGSDTRFAAMAGAGLRFPMGPSWEFDLGYRLRYFNNITLPSSIAGFSTCCGSNIITHSIQGGVTVKF